MCFHTPRALAAVVMFTACAGYGQQTSAVFESEIRPILKANCLACHSERNRTSGLSLETRQSLLEGGNRGTVVTPGQSADSLLIKAVIHEGDLKMPPTGKLKEEQIAALRRWVDQGLPWSGQDTATAKKRPGWDHWAFQPVRKSQPPTVKDQAWVRNPIDRFVLARLEKEGIRPSPEASRLTLLRRVSLDITGLPPSTEEIQAFLVDKSPDAYEKVVDRLLASEHFGERWGRHWLDLARYADSDGYTIDGPRQIWKYRDWVIQALNRDMPFDRFVIDQVAGDMLPHPTVDQLVATGFHRNTPVNFEGGIDFEQYRVEAVVDRVATTGAAFLGLTLGCARCHDHKYDPISQREFYQLFAFLNNIAEIDHERDRKTHQMPILDLPTPEETARRDAFQAQIALLEKELASYKSSLPAEAGKDPGLAERKENLSALRKREPKVTHTLVMRELEKPREAYIHLNGDFLRKGAPVSPGVPAVLPPIADKDKPNRLDFARWLVDPKNPLTPRVTVNRMWQRYFGKGLVETESDFGTQGAAPSHPELLDWLASEFVGRGWSAKEMHRLMVTSAAYRQSSEHRPELANLDPYNKLLARQDRVRLEAEIIRDAALQASGLLTPTVGGPSVFPPIPPGAMSVTQVKREWNTETGPNRYRRGLYTYLWRSALHPGLTVFDAPDAVTACTRRVRSNTPLQALTLLNDAAFFEFAQGMGARILKEAPADDAARLRHGFQLTLGRAPAPEEKERLFRFLALRLDEFRTNPAAAKTLVPDPAPEGVDVPQQAAWTAVSRVLLNLDEFMTRE